MEKTFVKVKNWILQNKKEALILAGILFIGAFLRLYKIDQYMTFLGDEGRDVIIVRKIFTQLHPPLIGPGTSIGNMYLGPLYYYFMAPALLLAGFSPVGPAVQIALLGVITVFFVWFIAREWFGQKAAVIASFFYAISPTVIIYSRSSWNPNIMPFFSLLCIYSIWRVWFSLAKATEGSVENNKNYGWLITLGISYAFVLQSHYLGLLLAPTLGLFWLLTYIKMKKEANTKNLIKNTVIGVVLFLILMSPLVIFDARHGWNNFAAIKNFFTVRQETVSIKPWKSIPKILPISEKAFGRLYGVTDKKYEYSAGVLVMIMMGISGLLLIAKRKTLPKTEKSAYLFILTWLGFAFLGLGLYKQEIYDHYYGFFFTAPFLLMGGLIPNFLNARGFGKLFNFAGKFLFVLTTLALIIFAFIYSPLRNTPNRQLERAEKVAQKIKEESGNRKLNLAVIAERNYEDGYQYFLEKDNIPVVKIDAQKLNETLTEQLFVVCEMPKEKCSPTSNAKAQVANFGWSKVEAQWEIMGATLFKLVHTQ